MDPLTLTLLGLSGVGSIGGLFMRDKTPDKLMEQARALFSPQAIGQSTQAYYRQFLNSPAFATAQRGTLGAANRLNLDVARNLGRTGLSQTGIGAVAGPLAGAAGSFRMGDLYSNAWQSALDAALTSAQGMTGAASSLPRPAFTGPQLYGGSLDSLSKALLYILMNRSTGGTTSGIIQ